MPCRKVVSYNGRSGAGRPSGGGYATEAECVNACKEGACCEGTTCSTKPRCQCQGAGKLFKGVGTTCTPNPCLCCPGGEADPQELYLEITDVNWVQPGTYSLSFTLLGTYAIQKNGCFSYYGQFFNNSQPCSTAATPTFTGTQKKLSIEVASGISSFSIRFVVCDYDATISGTRISLGGEVWGFITATASDLQYSICAQAFPLMGTTTQRNNPNNGGILNSISYRITAP